MSPSLTAFLSATLGLSFSFFALLFVVCIVAFLYLLVLLVKHHVPHRALGTVVGRDYSKPYFYDDWEPDPLWLLGIAVPAFFVMMPLLFPPTCVRRQVPAAPHLLILLNGVRYRVPFSQEVCDLWPNGTPLMIQYKLRRGGKVQITKAWQQQ